VGPHSNCSSNAARDITSVLGGAARLRIGYGENRGRICQPTSEDTKHHLKEASAKLFTTPSRPLYVRVSKTGVSATETSVLSFKLCDD